MDCEQRARRALAIGFGEERCCIVQPVTSVAAPEATTSGSESANAKDGTPLHLNESVREMVTAEIDCDVIARYLPASWEWVLLGMYSDTHECFAQGGYGALGKTAGTGGVLEGGTVLECQYDFADVWPCTCRAPPPVRIRRETCSSLDWKSAAVASKGRSVRCEARVRRDAAASAANIVERNGHQSASKPCRRSRLFFQTAGPGQ